MTISHSRQPTDHHAQHQGEPQASPGDGPSRTLPSRTPVGRSLSFERGVVLVLGLVALIASVTALAVGAGWFGVFRQARPVLDPMLMRWYQEFPAVALSIVVVIGLVLCVLGVWILVRALRPQQRPDVHVDSDRSGGVTVTSSALAHVVRAEAETVTGVARARVRTSGSQQRPHLQLRLSLHEGTNLRNVWCELDDTVFCRVREATQTETFPAAIHLDLGRAEQQRVR